MPPKGSQKPKKAVTPPPTPKKSKPATATKKKAASAFVPIEKEAGAAIPIDVAVEGEETHARQTKSGAFGHTLKLEAPSAFSAIITSGEYKGHQAILLRPGKAFPFLSLSKEVRKRVYSFYFAQKGVVNADIAVDGRRTKGKELFAKTYADGQKDRVALLAVNKEIHAEADPVFYANTIRFENTTTLLDFLGAVPIAVRPKLQSIHIRTFVKTTSRNAMHFLAESSSLTKLHFESGVFGEGDPVKAAKYFYQESYKFLEAIGAKKGDKAAGVDVLSFGKQAFTSKDEEKKSKPWRESQIEDFKNNLRGKLK